MKKLKVMFSFLLTVLICLSVFPALGASSTLTTTEKAEVLSQLAILYGDGNGDYNLQGQLKRSEAAAFVIRLIGKEKYVRDNAQELQITNFPDIQSNQWYAAYVGYCANQGIIAGKAEIDGTLKFKPDDPISEKEFLKVVLVAMGYEYGKDFDWTNVFSTAYKAGLVTDSSYLTRTLDNTSYKRENVVNVLYNTLTIANKATNKTVLQNLIDSGIITMDKAVTAGLIKQNEVSIAIKQLISISKNSIYVQFDQQVQDISAEDISIYASANPSQRLTVAIQAKQPDSVLITTSDQVPYENYTLDIINLRVQGSALSNKVEGTFSGFQASVVTSDFFRISKIEAINKSTVNVYFTHPLNTNSSNAAYYQILDKDGAVFASGSLKSLGVKYAASPDNLIVLSLQGLSFVQGEQYTVKVDGGLTSNYGVKLNDGQGDKFRFAGNGSDAAVSADSGSTFKITDISLLDYKTVQVTFNMEIHPTRAQQVSSFYITDSGGTYIPISKAAVGGTGVQAGKMIYLSINGSFVRAGNYNMVVNEIDDVTKQYSIEDKQYTFSGSYPNATALRVQSVNALDKNTISVQFDRPLDATTAMNKDYYSVTCPTQGGYYATPSKIIYDSSKTPNIVTLCLPQDKAMQASVTYKLTVLSVMKDVLGNPAGENNVISFAGSGSGGAKPTISDAVIISNDTVKVTTSRDIALNQTNIDPNNYTLSYVDGGAAITKCPLFVRYIDSKTLILKFDVLDFNQAYTLTFTSLVDYSEIYTRTSADGQNTFTVRMGK